MSVLRPETDIRNLCQFPSTLYVETGSFSEPEACQFSSSGPETLQALLLSAGIADVGHAPSIFTLLLGIELMPTLPACYQPIYLPGCGSWTNLFQQGEGLRHSAPPTRTHCLNLMSVTLSGKLLSEHTGMFRV